MVIERQRQINGLRLLTLRLAHINALRELPLYHKDPFDRMLIAQAINESFTLITNDQKIQQYAVNWLW